jgi:cell filamentation protein, protein adenylyltransferase
MAQQSHSARVAQDNLCDMGRTRAGFPFHFRAVHHHLFQDVYDWAGRDGKLRLTKGTSTFLLTREHRRELKRVFGWLKAQCYLKGRTAPNFAAGSAHFLGELNALHAFREGNPRAAQLYGACGTGAGHPFDFDRLDAPAMLDAMTQTATNNPSRLSSSD